MSSKEIIRTTALVCALAATACQQPPKSWGRWDGAIDDLPQDDAGLDAGIDAAPDGGGATDAEVGDAGSGDADLDAPIVDLCEGVFCFPDETCNPATGECTSEGLDCGEILACWYDDGLAFQSLFTCLLEGSAEGRRDFTGLLTCLVGGCLTEVLGAAQDPASLGLCAFEQCPSELMPCAGGFF